MFHYDRPLTGVSVESDTDLHYLHLHGCTHAQGFYVSVPVSADAFESWYWKHIKRYH